MEKTIENIRLKKLLKQQNNEVENDELQNDILEEIVFNSQFLCYIHYKKESLKKNHFENKKIAKKMSLTFQTVNSGDGKVYYPAFTDLEELKKGLSNTANKDVKLMIMNFDDYASLIRKNMERVAGVVINPFGDLFVMSSKWIEMLKQHKDKISDARESAKKEIEYTDSIDISKKIKIKLRKILKKFPNIQKAWLLNLNFRDIKRHVIVIQNEIDYEESLQKLSEQIMKNLPNQSMIIENYETLKENELLEEGLPFYKKRKFLINL
nr:SseB family protein [uncultured Leptotrichia sp.]